jgi:hypothetical protein
MDNVKDLTVTHCGRSTSRSTARLALIIFQATSSAPNASTRPSTWT